MVMRNRITKRDGNNEPVSPRRRPRKFFFAVGDYDVAVRKKHSYLRNNHYIHAQIWHDRVKVGFVDLTTSYEDVKTVMTVHTMISQEYQGLGIAYRVYEGLVNEANIAITSANQSAGAMKLWRKFAKNTDLSLYYVNDYASTRLFEAKIYDLTLNKDERLEIVDCADQRSSDPYKRTGSLLLVKKKCPLNNVIQQNIRYHKKMIEATGRFKPFDEFRI